MQAKFGLISTLILLLIYVSVISLSHNGSHGFLEHNHKEKTCQIFIQSENLQDDLIEIPQINLSLDRSFSSENITYFNEELSKTYSVNKLPRSPPFYS